MDEKVLIAKKMDFEWLISFPRMQKAYEIDGNIFISFINKEANYFSMTLPLVDQSKKEEEESNSESDDEPEIVQAVFNDEAGSERWATTVEYPLVFCSDKFRPQELHVMHLTHGMQERVILYQSDTGLSFVSFVKNNGLKDGT